MSKLASVTLGCACGHRLEAEVVESMNPSRRPDLRARILDGTLHRYACPACGRRLAYADLFAYIDFERRHFFSVFPDGDLRIRGARVAFAEASFRATMEMHAPPIVRSWAPQMLRRVIFGLASLRETLIALDAGLDDRVVQLLALELRGELRLGFDPSAYFHLVGARPPDSLTFEWAPPGEPSTRPLVVPFVRYQSLAALGEAELRRRAPVLFLNVCVDHRAALMNDASLPAPPAPAPVEPSAPRPAADAGSGEGYPP
jgi:hypothetical protein